MVRCVLNLPQSVPKSTRNLAGISKSAFEAPKVMNESRMRNGSDYHYALRDCHCWMGKHVVRKEIGKRTILRFWRFFLGENFLGSDLDT
ncbi:hypothetical protein JTE90_007863 [Oedothorax gibbosus]|uniref:Uncharacterized protein n=1 Tax=Oedothorax gibbosus TaxID=931172 RepID=A0AAV6VJN6_9ARAC|nr:hypothetical protein JTE90_007863 [Oedothorax gibbosus]